MSQAELADKMGTKQPAIARIEAGTANVRLTTLVEIAIALDATVRVQMEPAETALARGAHIKPWWERLTPLTIDPSRWESREAVHVIEQASESATRAKLRGQLTLIAANNNVPVLREVSRVMRHEGAAEFATIDAG